MTEELCRKRVHPDAWSSHECGRKVVEDGLCKLHLSARNRRRAKDAEYEKKMERGNALQEEAKELSAKLGIEVTADYSVFGAGRGSYTGDFTVPGDWLRALCSGLDAAVFVGLRNQVDSETQS